MRSGKIVAVHSVTKSFTCEFQKLHKFIASTCVWRVTYVAHGSGTRQSHNVIYHLEKHKFYICFRHSDVAKLTWRAALVNRSLFMLDIAVIILKYSNAMTFILSQVCYSHHYHHKVYKCVRTYYCNSILSTHIIRATLPPWHRTCSPWHV